MLELGRRPARRRMALACLGCASVLFVALAPTRTHHPLRAALSSTQVISSGPPTYPLQSATSALPTTTLLASAAAVGTEPASSLAQVVETSTTIAALLMPPTQDFSRPIPAAVPIAAPPAPAPTWAASTRTTSAGFVTTDVGCAANTSADALDVFFAQRLGPAIGLDYQHVYPLGGDRHLWLLQDTFIDHPGSASRLDQASFVHNAALVQRGSCFSLLHRGSPKAPASFELGNGETRLSKWFWPMGGEVADGQLFVFWVEMEKDGYEPPPGEGLGWHPRTTWIATYDVQTLTRLDFRAATNPGVDPIYGYATATVGDYSYLFGNTFEQNLTRDGGWFNQPHSGTYMWLARVPARQLLAPPEYRTADSWSTNPGDARPITQRFGIENPMQPRWLGGQWVAATKKNGYWGEELVIDIANDPWGPWTTVETRQLTPRGKDPLMNTYHAHLLPWLDGQSRLIVSVSQNARNMLRDAWPSPQRYRLQFVVANLVRPPPISPETVPPTSVPNSTAPSSPSTLAEVSTTDAATSSTTTTAAPTTTIVTTTSTVPSTSSAPTTTSGPPTTSIPAP